MQLKKKVCSKLKLKYASIVGIDMARWRLWLLKVYFNQFTNISKATLSKDFVVVPAESLTTSMQKADIDMHKAFSGKHFLEMLVTFVVFLD